MKRSLVCLVLIFSFLFSFGVSAEEKPALSKGCAAVLLMEQSTGTVLYEEAADAKLPIASVTKVMTLLLVAEAIDSGKIQKTDTVTVSENAASKGGSQIYLEVGETMSVDELLKAVVVASANDGATALGEYISGTEEAFVKEMNARAAELSLNCTFVNPTGLDDEGCHELSARDVAVISAELLRHEWITAYTTIWMDSVRGGAFGLTNTNRLVRFYEGTTGLKTGSTSRAKYCISASAKRDGMQLIAVVLGAESSDRRFSAAKELFDWGFANYALFEPENRSFDPIPVLGSKVDRVTPGAECTGILVKKDELKRIEESVFLEDVLRAPIEKGQKLGKVEYQLDGEVIKSVPITAQTSAERADFFFLFCKLLRAFFFG